VLVISITSVIYLYGTYFLSKTRKPYNRAMNDFDNRKRQLGVDALLNSDTVKEYVNESYEMERYAAAMRAFQKKEIKFTVVTKGIDLVQTGVLTLGFGICCYLCILMVLDHIDQLTVGDYVLITTYLNQIFDPLNICGQYYT